ncbi:MAG: hypothetical protein FJZ04_04330, partial [Candidatus Moranbacteria bacterium]|nr:hypothetical protein [Candidatus Moranbacteria bacterium]
MSKKLKTALFLGSLLFLVYVFFQHPGFQGYEDETYRRIWDNLASGEFRAARSGYAQIVLETPFVWAGKVAGMFFGANAESAAQLFANFYSPFISALSVAVFFLLVNLFAPRKRAFGVALAFGLLTMTFPYALIGMEPTAVFFLVTAVYFLFKFGQNKNKAHLVLSGLFYFLLFFSKAYYFVTIPAFLIYIFLAQNLKFKIQDLKNFVKGCLLFFSPLLVIFPLYFFANKYNFGVFFGGAYNLRVELLGGDNILFGLYGLLLSFGKSIFVYNPILLLSLFFVGSFYRKFQKEAVFLTIFSLLLLLFVSWTHWWSDETWGPRYLIAFIFPLMIPLALFRKKLLGFQTFKKVVFTV